MMRIPKATRQPMSIQEKFKAILANNDFGQLVSYAHPHAWDTMNSNERELLGILFVKQGEMQLKAGDSRVLESFEIASKVASHSPQVFFRQATVYAAQGQNIRCLISAHKALEKAVHLDPNFVSAWHSWGNVLVRMGLFYDDISYFYQADQKFHEAEHLSHHNGQNYSESLYWHWGICWYHIGKHSGEAVDFFRALEKFRLAEKTGCDEGEFQNDFGNVLIDLACLVSGRKELFLEAIDHYKKFTVLVPIQYEGWLNLACTYQRLFDLTGSIDYFHEADECFEHARSLNTENATVWLRWGELLLSSGKHYKDLERLQASLEKFQNAYALEPGHPVILLRWSEAQMLIGSYTENLELLYEAKNKINLALQSVPQEPDAWYILGICLGEFGRYFASEEYFKEAIEKFRYGLTLNPTHPLLLYGTALAYFAIGDMTGNVGMIEQAQHFFERIAESNTKLAPQLLNDWGVTLMKLGELTNEQTHVEVAAEKFELAISRRLDMQGAEVEVEWLYNYGCAMDFLGDFHEEPVYYEKAVQVLSHILQLDPEYHHARYNLALALYHLGELNSDVESLHKAIDLFHDLILQDPEDEMTWNDYGLTLLNLAVLKNDAAHAHQADQLFEQAESKLQQALALGNVNAFYNLACLYALTDNLSAAIHYLERAELADALPPVEDVMHDEWLENLRYQTAFRMLVSRLLAKNEDED